MVKKAKAKVTKKASKAKKGMKLVCDACGAAVTVDKACTCDPCGITCCGEEMRVCC